MAKSLFVVLLLALLALVAVGCSGDDDDDVAPSESTAVTSGISYLFVLDAESGATSEGQITLQGVGRHVLRFTDRPQRQVDYVSLDKFISEWDSGLFAGDPPNAAISWDANGSVASKAVDLTAARLEGETLVLTYSDLEESDVTILGDTAQVEFPDEMASVSLVVDGSTGSIGMNFAICITEPSQMCSVPPFSVLSTLNTDGPFPQELIDGTPTNTEFGNGNVTVSMDATEAIVNLVFPCENGGPSDSYSQVVGWLGSIFENVPSGEPACDASLGVSQGWCEGTYVQAVLDNAIGCTWDWTGVPTPVPPTATPTPTPTLGPTSLTSQIMAETPKPWPDCTVLGIPTLVPGQITATPWQGALTPTSVPEPDKIVYSYYWTGQLPSEVCERAQDVVNQLVTEAQALAQAATDCGCDQAADNSEEKSPAGLSEQWSCTLEGAATADGSTSDLTITCVIPGDGTEIEPTFHQDPA